VEHLAARVAHEAEQLRHAAEQLTRPVQLPDALRQGAQHLREPVGSRVVIDFLVLCHGYLERRRNPSVKFM
jgi:hypothetical protein